jgi:microcin C transport system substrate-binding protein
VKDGKVIREEFPQRASGRMQAFVFNLRRENFQDQRVRRAFNLAFDFEEMNKTVFYGQYTRIKSFFEGTDLAASDLPKGLEKELLEKLGNIVPPTIFTTPYTNPVNGSPEAVRANLREADRLLKEAGFILKDNKRVTPSGQPFKIELLAYDSSFERILLFLKPSLERLGIGVVVKVVDASQYENRMRDFDFDVTTDLWPQSLSPGNEQREYWGSKSADRAGSRNSAGIKNPAIDALIEMIVMAKNREEQIAATRALDRVLLMNDYVVPQWTYNFERTARWDRFDRPEKLPAYGASAFPTLWWYDGERAARIKKGG